VTTDRLLLPLKRSIAPFPGAAGLIAEVSLWVCEDARREEHLGAYHRVVFRIDTGSTHCSMSMATARDFNLKVPGRFQSFSILTAAGQQPAGISEGHIVAKFVGMEAHSFVFPCNFFQDRPANVPALLGLNGLRPQRGRRLRWTFDGNPATGAPDGTFVIEVT
jgi:hypothetical protein